MCGRGLQFLVLGIVELIRTISNGISDFQILVQKLHGCQTEELLLLKVQHRKVMDGIRTNYGH